jgi:hypothetical protein
MATSQGAIMSKIDPSSKPVGEAVHDPSAPLLLDLGRQKRKAVKQLRRGTGTLLDDVLRTIEELKTVGTISHTAQPVIIVIKEKPTVRSLFPML